MSKKTAVPSFKAWPASVQYLNSPAFAANFDKDARNSLVSAIRDCTDNVVTPEQVQRSLQYVTVKNIQDQAHPAVGQHGLFAARHLPPDSFIIQYLGQYHSRADDDLTSDYDLCLDRDLGIAVDASQAGNEARFINDYRGVSNTGPNAEFRDTWIDLGNGTAEKRIGVFVLSEGKAKKRSKGIGIHEEILVSYGKGFWNNRACAE